MRIRLTDVPHVTVLALGMLQLDAFGSRADIALAASPPAQTTTTPAQHHAAHTALRAIPSAVLERPIERRPGIGTSHEPVTTTVREAQAWYDEGLAHLHSFAWLDAARAFHSALRADPQLAMAQLGLSFAFGGLGSMQGAHEALDRARALQSRAGPRDRLRIDLRRLQLEALTNDRAATTYVTALDRALTSAPSDVELLLLRGDAASLSGTASSMRSDAASIPFFERAQRADAGAFAPRHYLAHAHENVGQIEHALRESQAYATMAPSVPHAHHMVGHSLRRLGRAREAIAAFERADALARAAAKTDPVSRDYDWHTHHNTNLLAAAYRYVGRFKDAEGLLRTAFVTPTPLLPEELSKRDWPALLLARGALAEALQASGQLSQHENPIVRAAGHLSAAHAQMAAGRLSQAGQEADAALRDLRAGGPAASELAPDLRLAQGEFLMRGGDREQGRSMIRQAIASLRARPGPDAWGQALFSLEAASRAVRQLGDATLTAELAEQMRAHDPLYAGTFFALAAAAEQRGDRAGARRAYEQAVRRFADADADHPDLTYARARLAALG